MINEKKKYKENLFYFLNDYEKNYYWSNFHVKLKIKKFFYLKKIFFIKIYFNINKKAKTKKRKNHNIKRKSRIYLFLYFILLEKIEFLFQNISRFLKINLNTIFSRKKIQTLKFFRFFYTCFPKIFLKKNRFFLNFFYQISRINKKILQKNLTQGPYFFFFFFDNLKKKKGLTIENKKNLFKNMFLQKDQVFRNWETVIKKFNFYLSKDSPKVKIKIWKEKSFLYFINFWKLGIKSPLFDIQKGTKFCFYAIFSLFLILKKESKSFIEESVFKKKISKFNLLFIRKFNLLFFFLEVDFLDKYYFMISSFILQGETLLYKKKKNFLCYFFKNPKKKLFHSKMKFLKILVKISKISFKYLFTSLIFFDLDILEKKNNFKKKQKQKIFEIRSNLFFSRFFLQVFSKVLSSFPAYVNSFLELAQKRDIKKEVFTYLNVIFYDCLLTNKKFLKNIPCVEKKLFIEEIFFFCSYKATLIKSKSFFFESKIKSISFSLLQEADYKYKFFPLLISKLDKHSYGIVPKRSILFDFNLLSRKTFDFFNFGIFFSNFSLKSHHKETLRDLKSFSIFYFKSQIFSYEKMNFTFFNESFIPMKIFRTFRIFSRFFFLKNNRIRNLIWLHSYSNYLVRISAKFCKKKENFFLFANYKEVGIILSLRKQIAIFYDDLVKVFPDVSDSNFLLKSSFLKMGLLSIFRLKKKSSRLFCFFGKKFRPKNYVTYLFNKEKRGEKYKNKTDLRRKANEDHGSISQAFIIKNIKQSKKKNGNIFIFHSRKKINLYSLDPRGLKFQIENLCSKNFVSYSKKKKTFNYYPD